MAFYLNNVADFGGFNSYFFPSQSQVYFDFTNNYLVIKRPTYTLTDNFNVYNPLFYNYRKPYLTSLKVIFISDNNYLPNGLSFTQEYELDYVGDYHEWNVENNPVQIEIETLVNYGLTLNPPLPTNQQVYPNEFKRFKFVDQNIVMTNPENLNFIVYMIESNRKKSEIETFIPYPYSKKTATFYTWNSTNTNNLEWCQPPPRPPVLKTQDAISTNLDDSSPNVATGSWQHFNFLYTSEDFPSQFIVTVNGFTKSNLLAFNNTQVVLNVSGQSNWTSGSAAPHNSSPQIVHYSGVSPLNYETSYYRNSGEGGYYLYYTTGFNLNMYLSWDGKTRFNIYATDYFSSTRPYPYPGSEDPYDAGGTVTAYERYGTGKVLDYSPFYLDFNDLSTVQHLAYNGSQWIQTTSRFSSYSNTTVQINYDETQRRWISELLVSNDVPFRIYIDNIPYLDLRNNVEPNKDYLGYYGSLTNAAPPNEAFSTNTNSSSPSIFNPPCRIYSSNSDMNNANNVLQFPNYTALGANYYYKNQYWPGVIDYFYNPYWPGYTTGIEVEISNNGGGNKRLYPSNTNGSVSTVRNTTKIVLNGIVRVYQFNARGIS